MSSFYDKIYSTSLPWFQNILVSLYGISLWHKRYSGDFNKILNEARSLRYQEKSIIDGLKLSKLRNILTYCNENIPYYKQLFKKHKFDVNSFNKLQDLEAIPLLDKEILREKYHTFLPEDYKKRKYVVQNTSGSTGTPLSILTDKYTYKLAMALLAEHEELHGIKMGDRRATFAGRMVQDVDDNKPPFWRYNIFENQMLFSAYHLNDENMNYYVKKINSFKPKEIIGYPSAIYTFAHYCSQSGIKLGFIPKAVITNSETLLEWQREVIESVFECKVFDYYGSAEYVAFAGQCESLNYHVHPELGIIEVIGDDCINIKNAIGEVVCTTLTNYLMPLIRYKIGDLGILTDEPCECGCHFDILKSIEGRIDDVVITEDGKKIGRLDHIFKGVSGIKECQIIQKDIHNFQLNVVKGEDFKNDHMGILRSNLVGRVGANINISIEFVKEIGRSSRGKFKGVISYCKL